MEGSEPRAVPARDVEIAREKFRRLLCAANSNVARRCEARTARSEIGHGGRHYKTWQQVNSVIAPLVLFGSSTVLALGALAIKFNAVWANFSQALAARLTGGMYL